MVPHYLQLPKEGATQAGRRRPIALLPMMDQVWAAWQKHRITEWRTQCANRGETPVGFFWLLEVLRASRIDLIFLEESAQRAGFPLEALSLAIDMYLSDPVEASSGIPAGCGLAVDLLHAFLQRKIHASELKVSARKYVDDMVLSAFGKGCANELRAQ
eukprot:6008734-Amphidinium_carterae.1